MTNSGGMKTTPQLSKYKISRRGRKLQISDDPRTLLALPKDVPERTWAEILQKEENELICFDIREEIIEESLRVGYEHYMEKQNALFTVYCAAQAWLKLIDWNFYRHDPGEDPSAHPLCYIPKRLESWTPDELPEPSPKDTWGRQPLKVLEECPDLKEHVERTPSSCSLEIPVLEDIPEQYRFPGKVLLEQPSSKDETIPRRPTVDSDGKRRRDTGSAEYSTSGSSSNRIGAESEVLQKVTDYEDEELTTIKGSKQSTLKQTTPVDGSLHGAGDSTVTHEKAPRKRRSTKWGHWSRPSVGRSMRALPPLLADSLSRVSVISDCRLRNLRLDTQFEVSDEKVDTPIGEPPKRK